MKSSFLFRSRVIIFCAIVFAIVLLGKLFLVQIVHRNYYSNEADRNYITPSANIYERGVIYFERKDGGLVSAATQTSGFKMAINAGKIIDAENTYQKLSKIIAIDYVKEMLEAAEKEMKSRQYKNIRLILGDAASMSFPNNYFDGIVYTLGLTAIPGHFEALKRCKKMLKPDGKIAVLDGKYSDIKYAKFIINSLLKVIRLEETWDSKKEVIKDLGKLFSITKSEKYFFDTIFILVGKKYRTHD